MNLTWLQLKIVHVSVNFKKRKRLTTCLFVSLKLKPTLTETTVVSQFLGHYTMKYTRSGYAAKIQKIIKHTVSKRPDEKLTLISKTHKTSQLKEWVFDNMLFVNKFRVAVENATVKLNIYESGIFITLTSKRTCKRVNMWRGKVLLVIRPLCITRRFLVLQYGKLINE